MTGFQEAPDPSALALPSAASGSLAPPVAPRGLDAFLVSLFAPPFVLRQQELRLVAGLACILAVWTDVLFYRAGLGINVTIWFASLATAAVVAGRRLGRPLPADRVAVLAIAVALSAVTAWRDSGALQFFGLVAALGLLGVGVGLAVGLPVRNISPVSALMALINCAASMGTSEWRLLSNLGWRELLTSRGRVPALRVVRALAITLPALLVFGGLFAAADAVFAEQVRHVFWFDLSGVAVHLFWLLFGAWFATAGLTGAIAVRLPHEVTITVPDRQSLGRVETGIVLGSLAILFALFVAVQIRTLFGGDDVVQRSVGLTYAAYARRGFFELVTASLLVLPLLAAINWARRRDLPSKRQFLVLAVILTALLFVIMASAWQRLAMYREAFGLTELRLYAVATLPWLAAASLWFIWSVARERMEQFLSAAALLAVLTLLALYVISPEDLIVRTNAARIEQSKPFDAAYAASLGADAVPVLIASFDALPAADRCVVAKALLSHADSSEGIRSWNLARSRASALAAQLSTGPVGEEARTCSPAG
ncbi:MAG: DUF4173 domain-containing protein [Dehalococcoidia bacterium]